ncbi:uncharacterized protein A4U43_C04F15770 [Asparagus officinalis]|uniref:Plant heme peroxidase family profile domain-containing protein n=1 Tax=Asparagus officinalis TaxID=4686 RepID=A0A5P1F157_ASPOF|nr:uncharacterized protein A4U43_C04F15770 [Asparagus officinalis]
MITTMGGIRIANEFANGFEDFRRYFALGMARLGSLGVLTGKEGEVRNNCRRTNSGRSIHVMTFEVGAVLEDEKWQAPVYCFDKGEKEENTMHNSIISEHLKRRAIQKKATTLSKL